MSIQKPRGTRDLFGDDLLKTEEICSIIKKLFQSYGYSEIQTPIFEHVQVFAENDSAVLGANKEFFYLESRNQETPEYILRPENTASVARALTENKLINKQIYYPLRYFYSGHYFRYERPQNGRYRQFMQMGIEKINSNNTWDDIENLLMIKSLQEKLGITLKLKLNFLGSKESKTRWNQELKRYFEPYRDQLTETSQKRISENPLRILDDKVDSKKDFVIQAPKIDIYLSNEEKENLNQIKESIAKLGIEAEWDPNLVRGIDYYTGLIYEWIDETEGLTIIAGGRYDQLFERFGYPQVPSSGLAIGVDRLKMILSQKEHNWNIQEKCIYLYSTHQINENYHKWVYNWRQYIQALPNRIKCIASYDSFSLEKHQKTSEKYCSGTRAILIQWGGKALTKEEQQAEFSSYTQKIYEV